MLDLLPDLHEVRDLVGEGFLVQFHADEHVIERPLALDHDLEVLANLGNPHQGILHLRGEDVDAPDDQHVVHPARDPLDAGVRPPAGTGARHPWR